MIRAFRRYPLSPADTSAQSDEKKKTTREEGSQKKRTSRKITRFRGCAAFKFAATSCDALVNTACNFLCSEK